MSIDPDVVALGAIINADAARLEAIAGAAAAVDDFSRLAARAESEGVAPVLYRNLCRAGVEAGAAGMNALRALAVRHRHATSTRITEFVRISDALADAGIESAALKGIALAGLIYPEPGLRPMRDIDFLVHEPDAARAREVLEGLGYRFETDHPSRFMRRHHHLPNARRGVSGLTVSVEIHTRANSGDSPGTLTLDRLDAPLQTVESPFGRYRALGHVDMLDQLCRHAPEPGGTVRLVSAMDIIGYSAHFDTAIDWERLAAHRPYVPNLLGLLGLVTPLPPGLSRFAWRGRPPAEPGRLIPPSANRSPRATCRRCLHWSIHPSGGCSRTTASGRAAAAARSPACATCRESPPWLTRRAIASMSRP
ncbi:MAG: nucleotidyltransferase family protein [Gammaproteobacteria bacterium]|nr:nucleotidyltransferase family protein [Gammaproteobacteria bacterium]